MSIRFVRFALIFTLALFVVFSIAACGSDDDDDASDDDATPADDDDQLTDDDSTDDDDDVTPEGRLYAGAASGYLNIPIGISLGGFAVRVGIRTAYNELMGGSRGYLDRPNVKAVALIKDDRHVVIAKVAMMGVTEVLRTQVVNQVKQATGVDLDRSLILNANHTHSGPARFMAVPDALSMIGVDKYSQQIVDRIAGSITDVIVQAIETAEPARIGFGHKEPFDPGHFLTADRRCADGPGDFKEDRLWVGQVENDEGDVMAVLVGMAMHGVIFGYGSLDLTGDAPDGVERAIEETYDHPVTAIYVQGSSGDVVPRTYGVLGHRRMQVIEWIGMAVARIVADVQKDIVTDDQPELNIMTRRYVTDRETLGYLPGEFGHYNQAGEFIEYKRGAMECGVLANKSEGSIEDCDEPSTTLVDGYLGCLIDLNWGIVRDYVDFFMQSPLTVAQIGDQYFFTAPGEITSHLAVDIRHDMAETLGVPFRNINTIGYSQNYVFYILQDWDWWQGGGEVNGSLFGWRYGPWMQRELTWLAGRLRDDNPPPANDPAPAQYHRDTEPAPIEISENLGVIRTQPPAEVVRFDNVPFEWHGGHSGIDNFTITLQREVDGAFVDVLRPNGTPYDDKSWEMSVDLYPTPDYRHERQLESRDFMYHLQWETSMDDPTGVLRFKVNGTALTADGPAPYEVVSDPFNLAAVDNITVSNLTASLDGGEIAIEAVAAYPPDPKGARRIRSILSGGDNPAIVEGGNLVAEIVDNSGNRVECELTFDHAREHLHGAVPATGLTGTLTITVEAGAFDDGFGNTNAEGAEAVVLER